MRIKIGMIKVIQWTRWQVSRGGRFSRYFPFFESVYSTFFGDKGITKVTPFVRDSINTKRYYFVSSLAITPLFLHAMYNQAYQFLKSQQLPIRYKPTVLLGFHLVLPSLISVILIGLAIEAIFAYKNQREIQESLPLFACFYCLLLPINTPFWLTVSAFLIAVLAKELQTKIPIHPALVGWAIVVVVRGFPTTPQLWQSPHAIFWMIIAALFLMVTNLISRKQFLNTVLAAIASVIVLKLLLPYRIQLAWDLLMKQTLFGAIFLITDIHTGPSSPEGRIHYGRIFGVGAIVLLVFTKHEASVWAGIIVLTLIAKLIDNKAVQNRLKKRIPNL